MGDGQRISPLAVQPYHMRTIVHAARYSLSMRHKSPVV
jgi:hypothetical protein